MKTRFNPLLILILAIASLACPAFAEEIWYPGEAECLGVIEGRPRVILTTVDGKKLALELRGSAESLMSKVLPEGKIAKVRVKGELKNRTLIASAYEMVTEAQPDR